MRFSKVKVFFLEIKEILNKVDQRLLKTGQPWPKSVLPEYLMHC